MQKIMAASTMTIRSGPKANIVGVFPTSPIHEAWDIAWDTPSKQLIMLSVKGNDQSKQYVKWCTGSTSSITAVPLPRGVLALSRLLRRGSGLCVMGFIKMPRYQMVEVRVKDTDRSVSVRQLNPEEDYDSSLAAPLASRRRQILRDARFNVAELDEPYTDGKIAGDINFEALLDEYAVNSGQLGQPLVRFNKDNKAVVIAGSTTVLARWDRSWKKRDISGVIRSALSKYIDIRVRGAYCDYEKAILGFSLQNKQNIEGRTIIVSMKTGNILQILDGVYVRSIDVFR
ncbi:MAG: hypothetical protein QM758_15500 [Armatimonas sp.]